ncbi:MAG: type II toxin-antitoxin system MqsR family toxin [Pseudomonadota bacterium]|uniref:Uncharacterized protein n=1 Tax=Candidatus Thiomargarita nelsonii TaxID=1003181 RepID=A0A0A6P6A5_9GAMM|nr:hypothetical protein PN36_11520 [Candidatus Thiomargarita nelsonii]
MPVYSLDTIHEVAQDKNKVILLGRKVEIDVTNLGYFKAKVAACLRELHKSDFHKTIYYEDTKLTFDVYKTKCHSPLGEVDDIYIKLKLNYKGEVFVEIGSFHLL